MKPNGKHIVINIKLFFSRKNSRNGNSRSSRLHVPRSSHENAPLPLATFRPFFATRAAYNAQTIFVLALIQICDC